MDIFNNVEKMTEQLKEKKKELYEKRRRKKEGLVDNYNNYRNKYNVTIKVIME